MYSELIKKLLASPFEPALFIRNLFELHKQVADAAKNQLTEDNAAKFDHIAARKAYNNYIATLPKETLIAFNKLLNSTEVANLRGSLSYQIDESESGANYLATINNLLEDTGAPVQAGLIEHKIINNAIQYNSTNYTVNPPPRTILDSLPSILKDISNNKLALFTLTKDKKYASIPSLQAWLTDSYRFMQKRPAKIKVIDSLLQQYQTLFALHETPNARLLIDIPELRNLINTATDVKTLRTRLTSTLATLNDAINNSRSTIEQLVTKQIITAAMAMPFLQKLQAVTDAHKAFTDPAKIRPYQITQLQQGIITLLNTIEEFNYLFIQPQRSILQELNIKISDWLNNNVTDNRANAVKALQTITQSTLNNLPEVKSTIPLPTASLITRNIQEYPQPENQIKDQFIANVKNYHALLTSPILTAVAELEFDQKELTSSLQLTQKTLNDLLLQKPSGWLAGKLFSEHDNRVKAAFNASEAKLTMTQRAIKFFASFSAGFTKAMEYRDNTLLQIQQTTKTLTDLQKKQEKLHIALAQHEQELQQTKESIHTLAAKIPIPSKEGKHYSIEEIKQTQSLQPVPLQKTTSNADDEFLRFTNIGTGYYIDNKETKGKATQLLAELNLTPAMNDFIKLNTTFNGLANVGRNTAKEKIAKVKPATHIQLNWSGSYAIIKQSGTSILFKIDEIAYDSEVAAGKGQVPVIKVSTTIQMTEANGTVKAEVIAYAENIDEWNANTLSLHQSNEMTMAIQSPIPRYIPN